MGSVKFFASGENMGYVANSGTTWTKTSARQGAYSTSVYYGTALFGSIGSFDFTGKNITNIRLTFDFLQAGANASKTLYLYRTAKTSITGTGSAMLGAAIGNLSGTFYANAHTFDFNADSKAAIFNALVSHLQAGGRGLCWYRNETAPGSPAWSTNYLSVSAVTMTVTYEDDFVWYNHNGVWTRCAIYYNREGVWQRCKAHFNSNGVWLK